MQRVMVTGFARQAAHLTALLNENVRDLRADYYPTEGLSGAHAIAGAVRCDAFIHVGGPRPHSVIRKICNQRRRPAIVLWVGTDVLNIAGRAELCEPLALEELVHWCCSPNLVSELRACGIRARYVPIATARVPREPRPLPRAFTVLAYLPEPRREFYGEHVVWEAAHSLPHARFVAVGRGAPSGGAPPNVEYAGEVADINAFIDESSVLLRITPHDGLPIMIIEALARGRHVITSTPISAVIHARSGLEGIAALNKLYEQHCSGELSINHDGMAYVRTEFSASAIGNGIETALQDALAEKRASRNKPMRGQVAISGGEILSARVARNAELIFPQYRPALLRTSTKSDLAVSAMELAFSRLWYTVADPNPPRLFEFIASTLRKPRVIHWFNGDAERLAREPSLRRKYASGRFVHFAADEDVLHKLRALDMAAVIAPAGLVEERIKNPA